MIFAAESISLISVVELCYEMASSNKYLVLQRGFPSLHSPDCDTECIIGIKFMCCKLHLLIYSHRFVHFVANWYKLCVLQTAFAYINSTDFDNMGVVVITIVCCREELLFTFIVLWYCLANCYTFCFYSLWIVTLSG